MLESQAHAELAERPGRRASLLQELGLEYPEICPLVVAEVLDRAFLAARLGTGAEHVRPRFVMVVARDRLDVLRTRRSAHAGVDAGPSAPEHGRRVAH